MIKYNKYPKEGFECDFGTYGTSKDVENIREICPLKQSPPLGPGLQAKK